MDNITKTIILIISASLVFQSVDVIDYFYQSKILSKYVVIARNGAFIISSLIKIYFIYNEYSVLYFAIAVLLDMFLSSIFLLIIYKNSKQVFKKWRFSSKLAINLLKASWPLALSTFLIVIYMKIDQVMIGNMLDEEQVGIYSAAVILAESWMFIPGILVSTFLPYFINLKETSQELYKYRLLQLYSFMFWMGVFVGILTVILGESMIILLFGESYKGAYSALVFNIWSGIAISQSLARGIWLISEDLQKYRLYNNIIAVILNIVLNLMLIPKYGIVGAAVATLLTQSLGVWMFSFLWKPLRQSTLEMFRAMNPLILVKN